MRKSIFILIVTAFMIGSLGTGCKMKSEKEEEQKEEGTDAAHEANQDAKIKMAEENAKIDEAEWNNFKKEIDAELNANEIMINDLKKEAKKSGKKDDAAYKKSIDTLEKKHTQLRSEINNYDKNQKNWDEFKTRFKKDVDAVEKEIDHLKGGKKK